MGEMVVSPREVERRSVRSAVAGMGIGPAAEISKKLLAEENIGCSGEEKEKGGSELVAAARWRVDEDAEGVDGALTTRVISDWAEKETRFLHVDVGVNAAARSIRLEEGGLTHLGPSCWTAV